MNDAAEHFDHCVALWLDWMQHDRSPGKPRTRDSVCGNAKTNYMTAADDSDIVYEANDRKVARAVHACFESLFNFEQNAVLIHYGLSRVYQYPSGTQAHALKTGMLRFRELVVKRC